MFKLGCLSLYCYVVRVFKIYCGYSTLVRNVICKYFLPFCGLSFHLLDSIVGNINVFNLDEVQFFLL